MQRVRSILLFGSFLAALVSAPAYARPTCDEPCCETERDASERPDPCCGGAGAVALEDAPEGPCACGAEPVGAQARAGGVAAAPGCPAASAQIREAPVAARASLPRPSAVRAKPGERLFLRHCALLL